jgi:hypothetical protein
MKRKLRNRNSERANDQKELMKEMGLRETKSKSQEKINLKQ